MAKRLSGMKLLDAVNYLKSLGYRCEDRGFGEFEAIHKSLRNLYICYDRELYVHDVDESW